ERSESESCVVFLRLSSAIYRSSVEHENRCIHHTWTNVRDHRNDLVSRTRLVRVEFQRTTAQQSDHFAVAQSNGRRNLCLSGSTSRRRQVTAQCYPAANTKDL